MDGSPGSKIKRPGQPPIVYAHIEPDDVPALLAGRLDERAIGVRDDQPFNGVPPLNDHPFFKYQQRLVLQDVGIIDPESIEDAIARGAYSAYLKVLFDLSQEEVIAEMTAANLRGRGGAGLPGGHQVGKRPQGAGDAEVHRLQSATKASRTSTRTAASTKAIRTGSSKAS